MPEHEHRKGARDAMSTTGAVRDLSLAGVLADHRQRRATQAAVIDGRTRLNYRELADRVDALAGAFQALGLGEGDRLLWLGGESSYRLLECLLAVARLGGVVCPVAGCQSDDELDSMLDDCAPSVLVCGVEHLPAVQSRLGTAGGVPLIRHDVDASYEALLRSYQETVADFDAVPGHAPVLMLYTSMIAGRPIGIQVSRSTLLAESVALALRDHAAPAPRPVTIGPLTRIASAVSALAAVLAGAPVVTKPSAEVTGAGEIAERANLPGGMLSTSRHSAPS